MTQNQKAVANLKDNGVEAKIENNTVYAFCGDAQLELADFEIRFRAYCYDTHKIKLN